jgi:hypothetical protein
MSAAGRKSNRRSSAQAMVGEEGRRVCCTDENQAKTKTQRRWTSEYRRGAEETLGGEKAAAKK